VPLAQVLTTIGSREEAMELARAAVNSGAAACVQVVGPITSVYRWKGATEEDAEFLLLMKVATEGLERLFGFVRERHPYDTPELTALVSEIVDQRYLRWATDQTGVVPGEPEAADGAVARDAD
jgi:periplasmic divalent cation tolerance protein